MIFLGFLLFGFGAYDGFGAFGSRGELAGHWGDVAIASVGAAIIITYLLRLVGGRT